MTPALRRVVLYTRDGCCLCDDALAVIEAVRTKVPFDLELVDIDSDPQLTQLHGHDIPVVLIDGTFAFKHRVDERGLRDRLAGHGIFARLFGRAEPRDS